MTQNFVNDFTVLLIWSQNLKVLCIKLHLVKGGIQMS